MARPTKVSIDYFPMDCVDDIGIKLIEAKYGLKGFAVIVKLLQKIYGTKGYYCEWNEEMSILFSKEITETEEYISEIINETVKRGLFDKEMYEKYSILTNEDIQRTYFEATYRRDRINVEEDYLLLGKDELPKHVYINGATASSCGINDNINEAADEVNVYINSVNDDNNPQSKVKESKVNEKKENKSKGEEIKRTPTPPSVEEIAAYAREKRHPFTDPQKFYDYYSVKGWPSDWKATFSKWAEDDEDEYNRKAQEEYDRDYEWQSFIGTKGPKNKEDTVSSHDLPKLSEIREACRRHGYIYVDPGEFHSECLKELITGWKETLAQRNRENRENFLRHNRPLSPQDMIIMMQDKGFSENDAAFAMVEERKREIRGEYE